MKKEKGITLIALVVTIIILLILAGITLSLVLSDGGLIDKSKEAIAEHKSAQEKEQGELGEAAEMIADLMDELKGGSSTQKTVADLKEGEWVVYDSLEGNIYCRVLYDNSEEPNYGVEIISMDSGKEITLGSANVKESVESYNNAFILFDTEIKKLYSGDSRVTLGRNVGSNPSNPSEEGKMLTHVKEDDICFAEGVKYRNIDSFYKSDKAQLEKVDDGSLFNIGVDYWFQSRSNTDSISSTDECGLRFYNSSKR